MLKPYKGWRTRARGGKRTTTASAWFTAMLSLILLAGLATITSANAAIVMRVVADRTPLDTTPVQVYATVSDSGGVPVNNLTQSDFLLTEDGSTQTISGFALPPAAGPSAISAVFAMDYSGSLTPSDITSIENAVASFITTQMRTDDVGAILKFGGTVNLITPPGFTSVKTDLETATRIAFSQSPGDGTHLYDALATALAQLNAAAPGLPNGPRAVILLTDGKDNGSTHTLSDVLAELNGSGIPVFSIAFGKSPNLTVLNAISQQSSGRVYQAADASYLQALYTEIAVRLQNEYLLSYSSAISDCNLHTLSVQVNGETASGSFRRCPAPAVTPSVVSSGGGGGGALHPFEWLVLLSMAVYRKMASTHQRNKG